MSYKSKHRIKVKSKEICDSQKSYHYQKNKELINPQILLIRSRNKCKITLGSFKYKK